MKKYKKDKFSLYKFDEAEYIRNKKKTPLWMKICLFFSSLLITTLLFSLTPAFILFFAGPVGIIAFIYMTIVLYKWGVDELNEIESI